MLTRAWHPRRAWLRCAWLSVTIGLATLEGPNNSTRLAPVLIETHRSLIFLAVIYLPTFNTDTDEGVVRDLRLRVLELFQADLYLVQCHKVGINFGVVAMSVIITAQEAEIERITVEVNPGKLLVRPHLIQ